MERIENQNIEFKQEYVSEIRKEAVAFANSNGGIIRIGIRKDGIVVGISDPDAVMVQTAKSQSGFNLLCSGSGIAKTRDFFWNDADAYAEASWRGWALYKSCNAAV